MDVETKDYKGGCRREEKTNGGKLRLSGADWFRVGRWIVTILILSTVAWTTLKLNVGAIAKDVKEVKVNDEKQDDDIIP